MRTVKLTCFSGFFFLNRSTCEWIKTGGTSFDLTLSLFKSFDAAKHPLMSNKELLRGLRERNGMC